MAQNCLQIVQWLKSWFTPKDEDYKYTITANNYNPNIDSTIQITITVTDGNNNTVPNHSFTLNADGTDVSLTTDEYGVATHTYTCDDWGLHSFTIGTSVIQINVKGYKVLTLNQGRLYYDNEKAEYVLNYSGSGTYNFPNWTDSGAFGTIPSELRPKHFVYSDLGSSRIRVRVNHTTGKVQYLTTEAITDPYFQCVVVWLLP